MKSIKKLIIILSAFALLFVSCASNPKVSENQTTEDLLNNPPENLIDQIDEKTSKNNSLNENSIKENSIENEDSNLENSDDSLVQNENQLNSENLQNETENLQNSEQNETENSQNQQNENNFQNQEIYEPVLEEIVPEILPNLPEIEQENQQIEPIETEPVVKDSQNSENLQNEQNLIANQNDLENENLVENQETQIAENSQILQNEDLQTEQNQNEALEDSTQNQEVQNQENKIQEEKVVKPSRSMTVQKNQLIDIEYPGKGWIYQENIDENGNSDIKNKNFIFGGRKLGGKNQSFTLRARVPGKFLLHFYKNDVLTGNYIDDYLEVIVLDDFYNGTEHAVAPSYAQAVPAKSVPKSNFFDNQNEQIAENQNSSNKNESLNNQIATKNENSLQNSSSNNDESKIKTVIQTNQDDSNNSSSLQNENSTENSAQNSQMSQNLAQNSTNSSNSNAQNNNLSSSTLQKMNADSLLEKAKELYNQKDYKNAFDVIKLFFDKAVNKIDEGLFVQGQILEAKSEIQNIKSAIDSYDLIVKNYPASSFWSDANRRSIYLKRFYINIR